MTADASTNTLARIAAVLAQAIAADNFLDRFSTASEENTLVVFDVAASVVPGPALPR